MSIESTETHPAVSDAMREAVAQWLRDTFSLNGWKSTAIALGLLRSSPIASEIARLTGERDAARADQRAMLIQVGEHARARGEAEGALWISEKAGIVEGWRARAEAAEEKIARLTGERDAAQDHHRVARDVNKQLVGEFAHLKTRAEAAEAETARLRAALGALLPGKLCGEISTTPDDERVQIVITFGDLRRARAALSNPEQADV